MIKIIRFFVVVVFLISLLGCGGGSGSKSTPTYNSSSVAISSSSLPSSQTSSSLISSSAASVAVVAHIEIEQTGLILTKTADTKQLSVKISDASGNKINTPVTWITSQPSVIAVDTAGKVTALVDNGSSQIIAEVNGIKSAPLLVVVTQPAANAILLNDSQIIGEPQETTPGAAPNFNNTYQISLSGIAAPAIGSLLINTESKMVAGRVIAVDTTSSPLKVTLGLISLRDMFPNLNLNEIIDLSDAAINIPAEISATYDVKRTGDTFTFTPIEFTPKISPIVSTAKRFQKTAEKKLGPFVCEKDALGDEDSDKPLEIELSGPPVFNVSLNPSLDMIYTSANGLERFVLVAEPAVKVDVGISVVAALEAKVECKAELFAIRIPVGGPLALVIGGLVPVGVGIETGGKLTLASMKLGAQFDVSTEAHAGISCPSGRNCVFDRGLEKFNTKVTPKFELPSLNGVRLEPEFSGFGYVEVAIGNPFLQSIRFNMLEVKAGAKLEGNFASMEDQLLDLNYKSNYGVALNAGADVGKELGRALELMGVPNITDEGFEIDTPIAKSPEGAATGAITADKSSFKEGDLVNFTVKLNTRTADFFPGIGPYNVKKIQLVRKHGSTFSVVAEQNAGGDNHSFVFGFPFTATDSGKSEEFSAFVVTNLLPFDFLALELGSVPPAPAPVPGSGFVHMIYQYTSNSTGTTLPFGTCCDEGGGVSVASALSNHDITFVMNPQDASGTTWETVSTSGSASDDMSSNWTHTDIFREDMSMRIYRLFGARSGTEKKGCAVTMIYDDTSSGGGTITSSDGSTTSLEVTPTTYKISLGQKSYGTLTSVHSVTQKVANCEVILPEVFTRTTTENRTLFFPVLSGVIDPATPGLLRGSQTILDGDAVYIANWEFQLPRE